jgi:hypothetical protein
MHTGWAACVLVSGSLRAPRVLERERVELVGDPERFVYHRAAELATREAERAIASARRDAERRARDALAEFAAHAARAGAGLVACGIAAKDTPMPAALDEIVAAHPRIHVAEGCFYRDAWRDAARSERLPSRVIAPRELESSAARAAVDALGKIVGRPWAKDQKLAALAALAALSACET